jgi:ATP-dependent DNA helicase RecG
MCMEAKIHLNYYIGDSVLETFVRISNESVVADSTEHKRLVLRGRNSSFDARPSDEMFEDYAFSKLRSRYYAWNGLSFDNKLYRYYAWLTTREYLPMPVC